MESKRYIYIILTQTGTVLSTVIKWITKEPYNHVSLSFEKSLRPMYSFGRYFASNPFFAGFVKEDIKKGIFVLKPKAECSVYKVGIDVGGYSKLSEFIKSHEANRLHHRFNFLGMMSVAINMPIRRKYKRYCAEFVSEALYVSGIHDTKKHHSLARAYDFAKIENAEKIYEGKLKEYNS